MKVLMLSHSNGGGGAGRATQRLFDALNGTTTDLRMHVDFKLGHDERINVNDSPLARQRRSARIHLDEIPAVIAGHPHPELFSPATRSAISAARIDRMGADIVDVHWVNFGYLSIEQLGKIRTPLVWHMHDMWAFTGGENYTDEGPDARWRYRYESPAPYALRWDVERWVYRRKEQHWVFPRHLIASSSWMARLAEESALMHTWPVHVIPNPINTLTYTPGDQQRARKALGLPSDAPLILALLPTNLDDPRKGFDLLTRSLASVSAANPRAELVIVGHDGPPLEWNAQIIPTHWLGRQNDAGCVLAYQAADVVVVPSRQDNSPQTATEALSCGTPVVAFNTTGLPDFITHEHTGYLAAPEDSQDLAHGIHWVLHDQKRLGDLGENARRAAQRWSPEVVAQAHLDLYEHIIDDRNSNSLPLG